MADNVQANATTTSGAIFRTFSDGTNEWPSAVVCFTTGGSAGSWALQQVTSSTGLPVAVLGTVAATQSGSWSVTIGAALPAGANVIGAVTQSGTWTVGLSAGSALIGGVELVDSGGTNKASISAGGAVKVDGSAVTQPVSIAATVATNVAQVGGSSVALGQTTMSASIPVAIASNQSAVTVSGTVTANAGTGTFTTSDLADGSVTGGTAGTKSLLAGGQYNTSAPSLSNGQQCAVQLDSSGFLKVNVAAGSSGNAAASATGSAVPADADYTGINVGGTLRGRTGVNPTGSVYAAQTDLTSVGGTSVALGQTTMSASIPVVIASNQSAVAVSGTVTANAGTGTFTVSGTVTANAGTGTFGTNVAQVGGSSVALGQTTMSASVPVVIASNQSAVPVSGTVTANAGTGNFGTNIAQISGSSVATAATGIMKVGLTDASGNALNQGATGALKVDLVSTQANATNLNVAVAAALPAGTNTIGNAIPVAGTANGATPYHLVSASGTNATSVKASAGNVYSIQAFNTNASARFLKLFNKASAPTVGTDTPVKTIMMPGNTSGAGATMDFPVGVSFSTGIAFAITGGIGDTDSTSVGASDCVVNIDYN